MLYLDADFAEVDLSQITLRIISIKYLR
jgi:hypothetical protein